MKKCSLCGNLDLLSIAPTASNQPNLSYSISQAYLILSIITHPWDPEQNAHVLFLKFKLENEPLVETSENQDFELSKEISHCLV